MTVSSAPWLEPAATQIYRRYSPPLRRFARRLLGNSHDASDAVQETFARAFRQLPTLEPPTDLSPWLHGIARNVCLESLKSRRRARDGHPIAADRLTGSGAPTPEQELIGRRACEIVRRALDGMPAARRKALSLRVEHGMAYQQIAALMGWTLTKAKVEVHRARRGIDVALSRAEALERHTARWLSCSLALVLGIALGGLLVGAAPGRPHDAVSESTPGLSLAGPGPMSDAGAEVAMCLDAQPKCEAPRVVPVRAAEIPWSDAPVTKLIEAP